VAAPRRSGDSCKLQLGLPMICKRYRLGAPANLALDARRAPYLRSNLWTAAMSVDLSRASLITERDACGEIGPPRCKASLFLDRLRKWLSSGRKRKQNKFLFVGAFALIFMQAPMVWAHPHVWVTMTTEVLYATDGSVTSLREAWTFDDMFSTFAVTGIQSKAKGQFTRDELQPLAQINADSLKDFAYFTYAKIDGKRQKDPFKEPIDYWFDYDPAATVLTLHYTLPFKTPVMAKRLQVEIYDPEFFIDFGFAKGDAVKLVGAPARCTLTFDKPADANFPASLRPDQSFIPSEAFIGMGSDFSNKIVVQCP
jgi:ABC-type uncharacterized transport system substrate-binding protein